MGGGGRAVPAPARRRPFSSSSKTPVLTPLNALPRRSTPSFDPDEGLGGGGFGGGGLGQKSG
ncbi:hypothetical protein THAOC_00957, partial [Thalassiosira oceanica]